MRPLLVMPLMVLALLALRGSRTPNPVRAVEMGTAALDIMVIAFAILATRRPTGWARAGAAISCAALLAVPPSEDAWLSWLPPAIPAALTLLFIASLYSPSRGITATHWRDPRLGIPLFFVGLIAAGLTLAPGALPSRWGDSFELHAATGPLLVGLAVCTSAGALALSAIVLDGIRNRRKRSDETLPEEGQEWREIVDA